jgi:hypothetical protein
MPKPYPTFDNLHVDESGPRGNAWGLWGPEDQLGTLNHLTAERVRLAAQEEIRVGERVSLKYGTSRVTLSNILMFNIL